MNSPQTIIDLINKIINRFNQQEQEIFKLRILSENEPVPTLQEIANKYNLTRERINQKERKVVNIVYNEIVLLPSTENIFVTIISEIELHSGVISFNYLLEILNKVTKSKKVSYALIRILIIKKMLFVKMFQYQKVITLDKINFALFIAINNWVESYLSKEPMGKKISSIYNIYNKLPNESLLSEKQFQDYISLNEKIDNKDEIFFHKKSGFYSPRTYADYIYIILREAEKPLHFSELAKLIENKFNARQKITSHNLHGALIHDNRFVWVGRGMYALKAWGFKNKSTKEMIRDFLSAKSRPMKFADIADYVQDHRLVKRQTVNLNLSDKQVFTQIGKGVYALKEWRYVPTYYDYKKYQICLGYAVKNIFLENNTPLSIGEIAKIIKDKYGTKCSSNQSSIYNILNYSNEYKKDLYGKFILMETK